MQTSHTSQAQSIPVLGAIGIPEFCRMFSISRAMVYKQLSEGKGPRTSKIGSRTVITLQAVAEWQKQMEQETAQKK